MTSKAKLDSTPQGSERKSILLITQPTMGGAALQVWQLAAGLDRERFDVTVVSPAGGWLSQRVLGSGGSHVVVEMAREIRPLQDLRSWVALRSIIRSQNPHLVHCHSSKAGFLGRIAGLGARAHVVLYTPHGFSFESSSGWLARFYTALETWAARFTDRIICVSDSERTAARRSQIAKPEKLLVIHNGVIVLEDPERGNGSLRRLLGVGEDCRIVAMVSRLRRPKCPEDLLNAAAILTRGETQAPLRFVFIGSGPLERELRDSARSLGIGDQMVFLGDRTDVPQLMSDVDIAVLASSAEAMPYSILEAMAAGKPVVGTRVPGVQDLILEGGNGYTYPLGDASELASVLQKLLSDGALRRRLGAEGRRIVLEGFTTERMVRETEGVYQLLLDAHSPRTTGQKRLTDPTSLSL